MAFRYYGDRCTSTVAFSLINGANLESDLWLLTGSTDEQARVPD